MKRFDKLFNKILQESKTNALPPEILKIIPEIVDWVKGFCIDSLWEKDIVMLDVDKILKYNKYPNTESNRNYYLKINQKGFVPIIPFEIAKMNFTPDDWYGEDWWVKNYKKTYDFSNKSIKNDLLSLPFSVELCTWNGRGEAGGAKHAPSNKERFIRLNLYIGVSTSTEPDPRKRPGLYPIQRLEHIIIHELTHLFDPTNIKSSVNTLKDRRSNDKKLKNRLSKHLDSNNYHGRNFAEFDYKSYTTHTGYRSGNIPIEFYPNLNNILKEHTIEELKNFLRNPDKYPLKKRYSSFVKYTFQVPYAKRKLLDKIYHHVYNTVK